MVKEFTYTSIKEVLSRTLRHPLLLDVTFEAAVLYVIDFLGVVGMPKMYQDKEADITITSYRGTLPTDLISINAVRDTDTKVILRSMTDIFLPSSDTSDTQKRSDEADATFKTLGTIIYTSFESGTITVSYKAIPVDDEGYPLIIDNSNFLRALDLYIKKLAFTILFDLGKISPQVLLNTLLEYAWAVAQLQSEFTIPSMSELESLRNSWCTLLLRSNEFAKGFKHNGAMERIRVQ